MNPLDKDDINQFLSTYNTWHFEQDALVKNFLFDDFKTAFSYMTRIAFEAEMLGHHPEWKNVYNRLEVRLTTHDAGNKVSQKDVDLAILMDQLF